LINGEENMVERLVTCQQNSTLAKTPYLEFATCQLVIQYVPQHLLQLAAQKKLKKCPAAKQHAV